MESNVSGFIWDFWSDGSGIDFSEKKEKEIGKEREVDGGVVGLGLSLFIKHIDYNWVS